jgi:general secretion pathway protein C
MSIFSNWRSFLTKRSDEAPSFTQIKKRLRNLPLVGWIIIVLSILLLLAIVQLVLRFQTPSIPANLTIKESQPPPAAPSLNKLAELHLFGQNMSNQDINSLPQTSLKLELQGIYSSPSPELGSAIIAAPGESSQVYLVGDTLPGGAVLIDVYEDRVILRRAGQLEALPLPQHFLEAKK